MNDGNGFERFEPPKTPPVTEKVEELEKIRRLEKSVGLRTISGTVFRAKVFLKTKCILRLSIFFERVRCGRISKRKLAAIVTLVLLACFLLSLAVLVLYNSRTVLMPGPVPMTQLPNLSSLFGEGFLC